MTAQANRRVKLSGPSESVEAFRLRVKAGPAEDGSGQKRQLVGPLIGRVVVTGGQVESRYVIPTGPNPAASIHEVRLREAAYITVEVAH